MPENGSIYTYYCSVLNNFEYTQQHPYQASLKSLLSIRNTISFRLSIHLHLIKLHNETQNLIQTLQAENLRIQKEGLTKQARDEIAKERLKKILQKFYALFERLAQQILNQEEQDSLKLFKKLIHRFDREVQKSFNKISPSCRIFNLNKLKQKITSEINQSKDQENKEEKINKWKKQLQDIEKYIEHNPNRKYAYLPDSNFNPVFTEQKKDLRRRFKKKLRIIALLIAILIGLGQGASIASLMASTAPALIPFLVIGGFFCNYHLLKESIYQFLKDLFYGRLFRKNNGVSFNKKEKALATTALIVSFIGASFFFLLSFNSAITFLGLIGLASNPIGLSILSALIAGMIAIILFVTLSHMSFRWIQQDGPQKLKQKLLQFKHNYIDFWKTSEWKEKSKTQKITDISKKIFTLLLYFTLLALSIGIIAWISILTAGSLRHQSATMLQNLFYTSLSTSNMIAHILSLSINAMSNTLYCTNILVKIVNLFQKIGSYLIHPQHAYQNLLSFLSSATTHPIRLIYQVTFFTKQILLLTCIGISGLSGHVNHSVDWIKDIIKLRLNIKIISLISKISSIFQFTISNTPTVVSSCQLPLLLNNTEKDSAYKTSRVFSTGSSALFNKPESSHREPLIPLKEERFYPFLK